MAEIAALPPTGLRVVSTFSGCGGSCLGFRMAGFTTLWANEFVPAARETYAANHPEVILDGRDVREVKGAEIMRAAGLAPGEADVMEGSPPCSSFSTAGKRSSGWGQVKPYSDTKQRTDDLFFEFVRLLSEVRPRAFVAENVSGLVKGVAKGYFKEILAEMRGAGYCVSARLLDAKWLGVPQSRQRLIFVGFRSDLGLAPVHPRPLPFFYSVRDALPALESVVHDTSGLFGKGEVIDDACPAITIGVNGLNSCHFRVSGPDDGGEDSAGQAEPDLTLDRFAIGKEWDKLGPGQQSERYFNLVRPNADRPCPTVTQMGGVLGVASVTHPTEKRKFTMLELRRVCGFPDDFRLTGTYTQRWERLGRAVPPVMMFHVAREVREQLFRLDGREPWTNDPACLAAQRSWPAAP